MKFPFLLSCLLLSLSVFSQIPIDCTNSCSYYGEEIGEETYGFTSDEEARNALQNIVKHTGLPVNFTLMAGNVPNASAIIRCNELTGDCDRYILYNQDFMLRVKQKTKTDWAAISILAHEIGHHLSGHTLLVGGSRPALELQADKFSGFVLYNMGATLDEAQIAINTFVGDIGGPTHPGRSARIAAITNGWIQASEINPGKENIADEKAEIGSNKSSASIKGIQWRHDGAKNKFALFVNGVQIAARCNRSYCGDHYILYDPLERNTYLLENFRLLIDNQLRSGKLIGTGESIFWRHDGANKQYGLYVNGLSIGTRCIASYSKHDYLIFDPEEQKTYLLENFRNLNNNLVYKGKLIGKGPSIFWRHDGEKNLYALYVNGQLISTRCNASYSQDHYIVYDPEEQKTYLFENFANLSDNTLRTGSLIARGPSIFWRFDGKNNKYALYVNGQSIGTRCQSHYLGNDLVVFDPQENKTYILENLKNLGDNRLRLGRLQ